MKNPVERFPQWLIKEVNRCYSEFAQNRAITLPYIFTKDRHNQYAIDARQYVWKWLIRNIAQSPSVPPKFARRTEQPTWEPVSTVSIGLLMNVDRTLVYSLRARADRED